MLAAADGSLVAISLRFQGEIYVPSLTSSGSFSFFSPPTNSVNKDSSRAVADTYLGQLSNGAEYGPAARTRAEGSQCRSQLGGRRQVARHRSGSFITQTRVRCCSTGFMEEGKIDEARMIKKRLPRDTVPAFGNPARSREFRNSNCGLRI
jgi:hypothetical protein